MPARPSGITSRHDVSAVTVTIHDQKLSKKLGTNPVPPAGALPTPWAKCATFAVYSGKSRAESALNDTRATHCSHETSMHLRRMSTFSANDMTRGGSIFSHSHI